MEQIFLGIDLLPECCQVAGRVAATPGAAAFLGLALLVYTSPPPFPRVCRLNKGCLWRVQKSEAGGLVLNLGWASKARGSPSPINLALAVSPLRIYLVFLSPRT